MILTRQHSLRRNDRRERRIAWIATAVVAALMGVLIVFAARASSEEKTTVACLAYAAVVTVFLGGILWGFILSQTRYSESVEAAKFDVLEKEDAEWKR